jgi:hypothetical protein
MKHDKNSPGDRQSASLDAARRLRPVTRAEPDQRHCRAVVQSGRGDQQCSRRPTATRQGDDGEVYRVCGQHQRAQFFWPWSALSLMSAVDACRWWDRVLLEAAGRAVPPRDKFRVVR